MSGPKPRRPAPGPAPRRRGRRLVVGALLVLTAGAGAAWWVQRREPAGAAASSATFEVPDPPTAAMQRAVARTLAVHRDAVRRDVRSGAAWGRFGRVLQVHGLLPEAETCYRRAIALDAQTPQWRYHFAIVRDLLHADAEELIPLFEEVLALTNYPPAAFQLGDALVRRDRLEEACRAFRGAVTLDPAFALAHRSLGQALHVLGDLPGAREHLEAAVRSAPGDGGAQSSLALVYRDLGDAARAADAAWRAQELPQIHGVPDPVMFELQELGMSARHLGERIARLMSAGELEAALVQLGHLGETRPDDPSIYHRQGECLERLGRHAEAMNAYARAVRIEPGHPAAARLAALSRRE